ncbi:MAG: glycoside hydrolase, partial [Spirochaetia bacterium]
MKNSLILHGHFYQPPREHPWTGLIPNQESAAPFHDWNQRITKECYAANTASRFLRYDGRIEDIINNYEILSFNFGPTLLGWLRTYAPHIHEAIVEADKRSILHNNGHGNAIAQSYNHTILPLDTEEDARLQIRWGLRDFYSHFGREAEGMWLPETGVNGNVLDLLIEEGLKYVILSPWQAKSIKAEGSREKTLLDGTPAPSWRPYRIEGKRG